jgi:NAD+ synthase
MSLANTRARLRMTTLYYFAALQKKLVVGTGNRVEDFGIGFFTKYGDGGVDISPIADLMKSEVYELGKHLQVSEEIMVAPPTDGLWGDDRTDEDQIGATYPELEWAMNYLEEVGVHDDLTPREREVLAIYKRLNLINQHKMNPIPVCEIPEEFR